uniref:Dynein axonemal assembly factor 5 TPR repeats domain-containing protein n=1 Tax=Monopterus albus TaxID=43700 RepID=A0A3Q3Q699_MONAL|nr:radial spoke head 14 homolog [Monopterus albus]XP_020450963.1 radial spoke head 14 homolog [Monopterus albus]
MAGVLIDPSRAPVPFGRWAVPQLFEELRRPETDGRRRALASLCDLMHDPERIYQTVNGGFLEQCRDLLMDEDPSVRTETCELLNLLTGHAIGRQALLSSSLLPPLSQLLDDDSSSCRTGAHHVLNCLAQLPAAAEALLSLVPKLMLKLGEEEEEEAQVLLLSTVSYCSRMDPLPALSYDGVSLLGHKLSHRSPNIRREAAAAMMALSVLDDGKRQVCEGALLPVLVHLLQDDNLEVQTNAAGVLMYTLILTTGKQLCLELGIIPVLLHLVKRDEQAEEKVRKALILYSLRALTSLAEAPDGRHLLLEQLPLLVRRSEAPEEDQDIRQAAQTAIRVINRAS